VESDGEAWRRAPRPGARRVHFNKRWKKVCNTERDTLLVFRFTTYISRLVLSHHEHDRQDWGHETWETFGEVHIRLGQLKSKRLHFQGGDMVRGYKRQRYILFRGGKEVKVISVLTHKYIKQTHPIWGLSSHHEGYRKNWHRESWKSLVKLYIGLLELDNGNNQWRGGGKKQGKEKNAAVRF
jgi:hypothetical protein